MGLMDFLKKREGPSGESLEEAAATDAKTPDSIGESLEEAAATDAKTLDSIIALYVEYQTNSLVIEPEPRKDALVSDLRRMEQAATAGRLSGADRLRATAVLESWAEHGYFTVVIGAARSALAAIGEIGDSPSESDLAEIATKESSRFVRRWAVDRLADQALLADIARTDGESSVRSCAASRVEDQEALAGLLGSKDSSVREAAVRRLSDSELVAKMAESDDSKYVREAAALRLRSLRKKDE